MEFSKFDRACHPRLPLGTFPSPDSFYPLTFWFKKSSTWIWRLPFAVKMTLNLSIKQVKMLYYYSRGRYRLITPKLWCLSLAELSLIQIYNWAWILMLLNRLLCSVYFVLNFVVYFFSELSFLKLWCLRSTNPYHRTAEGTVSSFNNHNNASHRNPRTISEVRGTPISCNHAVINSPARKTDAMTCN